MMTLGEYWHLAGIAFAGFLLVLALLAVPGGDEDEPFMWSVISAVCLLFLLACGVWLWRWLARLLSG